MDQNNQSDIILKNDTCKITGKFEDSKLNQGDHCSHHNPKGVGKNSSRSNSGKAKVSADHNREEPRNVPQDEQVSNLN